MSLIEEALRRVQEISPGGSSRKRSAAAPPATESTTPHRRSLVHIDDAPPNPLLHHFAAKWIGLLGLLGIIVGVSLWTYRVMLTLHPVKVELPAQVPEPVVVLESPTPPPEPPPPPPPLKLTGIVEGVGEPFAIINEQIVRLGEDVDGAVLVTVGNNRARLRRRDSNEEVLLQTTR